MMGFLHKKFNVNFKALVCLLLISFHMGTLRAAEITWEFDGVVALSGSGSIEGYFTHDSATQTLSDLNVKATVGSYTYEITEAGAVDSTWLRGMVANEIGAGGFYLKASDLNSDGSDSIVSRVGAGPCSNLNSGLCSNVLPSANGSNIEVSQKITTPSSSSTSIKTPAEAFTEVEDDIGAKMKSNTTKQIRSFATATTAVVSSARGRVFSKRVSSSRSGGASRSSGGGTRSTGGGGGSDSSSGGGGSSSDGGASGGTDGGDNDNSNDSDTESSFDLRSSSRGTNASGKINGVLQSADGKLTRYTETQFSYTESENETETGSASSQVIFEREQSEDLTIGRFIGFSLSKNSTVDTNTTNIESVGLQVGSYFVRNMTEDLFVDGYVAASLLTNNMEVTTSSMTAEADYVSRMAATGLAITGSLSVDRWEILPTFGVDYSVVSSQDAEFEVTSGAGNSNELSSPGHVKQLSLSFSPDFRTSFDYYNGYWSQGSTFSVKPKVTCQRIDQDTIIEECGQGATVSVTSQDESQMKTLAFTLGIDTISNDTTYSANALYKVEF